MSVIVLKRRGAAAIQLAPGLTVQARPASASDYDLAAAIMGQNAVAIGEGNLSAQRYGLDLPGSAGNYALALKISSTALAVELGVLTIRSWEGVGIPESDEEGAPLIPAQVEPAAIALLFNEWATAWPDAPGGPDPAESYGARFMRRMNRLSILEPGSKNASTASPDTSTAAAVKAAGDASSSANVDPVTP